jgi:hypothetical protein
MDNTVSFEGTVWPIPKTSPFRSYANKRIDVDVLDGAVEFFYKTEKIASYDSKTKHTIGLYRTIGKTEGFRAMDRFRCWRLNPRCHPDIFTLL